MEISPVSRVAILTLICRAVEAQRNPSAFDDPMAVLCLERLVSATSGDDRRWIQREVQIYQGFHERDAKAGVRRSQCFDCAASHFITERPGCTVINLGCGFDTRFWRIDHEKCQFIDIDLPEVIQLKKALLHDHLEYEMIGGSVLDTSWMNRVLVNGNSGFLLLAEGLFMYFPEPEAIRLFREIGERFCQSQLVLDMVLARYTRGIWRQLLRLESRITWGLDAPSWVFGIRDPGEIEAYGRGLKVTAVEKGSAGPVITVSIHAGGGP